MKKLIISVLIVVLLILNIFGSFSYEVEADNNEKNYVLGLQSFLDTDSEEYLLRNENYAYWKIAKDFETDFMKKVLIGAVDLCIECGEKPDVTKYTEVLVNIIATYEQDNASDIAVQKKSDHMKTHFDYAMDITQIGVEAVDLMVSGGKAASALQEWISKAVSGLGVLAESGENWITALSDLETLVQNYTKYDYFLAVIEENASGDLKKAASALRKSMQSAMEIKLGTYIEISEKNFNNYSEFLFTELFFDSLKLTEEYKKDSGIRLLTDLGSSFIDKLEKYLLTYKTAWDLGSAIGTLVGNVAVGGEDIVNRLHEMMALRDIGDILCEELEKISDEEGAYTTEQAQKYFTLCEYLIGCRIRGEYCKYSVVASDSGLLSKFGFDNVEEIKSWYETKCSKIIGIYHAVETACDAILVPIKSAGYDVGELSEWYVYNKEGSLCDHYVLSITGRELMHIGPIEDNGTWGPVKYTVTKAEPLSLELEAGYWYYFEIEELNHEENNLYFTVSVNGPSEGLIDMIPVYTEFGESYEKSEEEFTSVQTAEEDLGDNGCIRCQIVDADDESIKIKNASVTVTCQDSGASWTVETDNNGFFEVILWEGEFSAYVIADGYKNYDVIDPNGTLSGNILVQKGFINDLGGTIRMKRIDSVKSNTFDGQGYSLTENELKEIFLNQVADDMIFFFCEDYDHNGSLEAFGATGILDDFGLYTGVKLYYVSDLGDAFHVNETYELHGFAPNEIMIAGEDKFIVWELSAGGSGSTSYIYGVKNGEYYEPMISRKWERFQADGKGYVGYQSSFEEGFHDWIPTTFNYNSRAHEFEKEYEPYAGQPVEHFELFPVYQGHHYAFYTGCSTWEEAKAYCESLGGYLAVISSKAENDAVYKYMLEDGYRSAYFGLSDAAAEGEWTWIRENSTYTNWHESEPNTASENDDYAMFYWKYNDGTWNDGNFADGTDDGCIVFVCEWDY